MAVDVVIFAGGVGRRMDGSSRPKQFLELGGRPIIDYTIAHFAKSSLVSHVVVACLKGWIPYLREILEDRRYRVPVDVIPGGSTGQESIFLGLDHLHRFRGDDRDNIVLVHDGVRPLITEQTIADCVRSVEMRGATATVAPATETIVTKGDHGSVEHILQRSSCSYARAPQGFRLAELHAAHLRAQAEHKDDFIDSVSMMSHYGYPIYTIEGPAENIKVTTPMDYYAFKGYMEARDQRKLWGDVS